MDLNNHQMIVGPKRVAVKQDTGRFWYVTDFPADFSDIRLGLTMALSRPESELKKDPSASPKRVLIPLPVLECGNVSFRVSSLFVIVLSIFGAAAGKGFFPAPPSGLIQDWRDLFLQLAGIFLGFSGSVVWQGAMVSPYLRKPAPFFGIGRFRLVVEPVVWRLGVPAGAAVKTILVPFLAMICAWLWQGQGVSPAFLTGISAGGLVFLMVSIFPLRSSPGTRIVESLLKAEELPQRLKWAVAGRFLPAGQSIKTGESREMALAGISLAGWVIVAGLFFRLYTFRPDAGASMPGTVFSGMVSLAGIGFSAWLIFQIYGLGRFAYLLRGKKNTNRRPDRR